MHLSHCMPCVGARQQSVQEGNAVAQLHAKPASGSGKDFHALCTITQGEAWVLWHLLTQLLRVFEGCS